MMTSLLKRCLGVGCVLWGLTAVACGNDGATASDGSLLGSWDLREVRIDGAPYHLSAVGDIPGQMHFYPDGRGLMYEWWGDWGLQTDRPWDFKWRTEGDQLFWRELEEDDWGTSVTFTVDGDRLVLSAYDPDRSVMMQLTFARMP